MLTFISKVESAITDLKNGKMIIITDDVAREDEGDLIMPAEMISDESMNFIIRNSSGIVCVPILADKVKQLGLSFMVPPNDNTSLRGTPFTVSIDAKEGITTGVSAADRVQTIKTAIARNATAEDLVKPGHIFPLVARDFGVLARAGHTEAAVDIVRLAGFQPAGVLCEIMNSDGTMARGQKLKEFAERHQLNRVSIAEMIDYRLLKENVITEEAAVEIPLNHYGNFKMTIIKEKVTGLEHILLEKAQKNPQMPILMRIHSSCCTGDLLGSLLCDCHQQLHYALQKISQQGGLLVYLNQEGRGIGLLNKIKAYALQAQGLDTLQANEELHLPVDNRNYHVAAAILRNRNIKHICVLTNNPAKINDLKKYGIETVSAESTPAFCNPHNQRYLQTKKIKLHHAFQEDLKKLG